MKKLTNITELKKGDRFYLIKNGSFVEYEFVCMHPHNPAYILAIESLSQNAPKLYIPNIIEGEYYLGPYDRNFIKQKEIEYYKTMIKRIEDYIEKDESAGDKVEMLCS